MLQLLNTLEVQHWRSDMTITQIHSNSTISTPFAIARGVGTFFLTLGAPLLVMYLA